MPMYIMKVFKKEEQNMDSENIQLFNTQPNIGPTNLSVWGYTNHSTLLFASGKIGQADVLRKNTLVVVHMYYVVL